MNQVILQPGVPSTVLVSILASAGEGEHVVELVDPEGKVIGYAVSITGRQQILDKIAAVREHLIEGRGSGRLEAEADLHAIETLLSADGSITVGQRVKITKKGPLYRRVGTISAVCDGGVEVDLEADPSCERPALVGVWFPIRDLELT